MRYCAAAALHLQLDTQADLASEYKLRRVTVLKEQIEDDEEIRTMRENFRSLRQACGWTVEELSKLSGIRVKILNDIEEGGDFNIVYLIRLCNLYHIKPAKIFFAL